MAIRLGDEAPNFTAETTEGTVDLYDYLGDGWGMLFSHPKDFTPVCTTELGAFAKRKGEFDQRNVKLIGVSVDPLDSHQKLGAGHRGDAGHRAQLPADRRPRAQGRRPLRHDPPERERHDHRALGVHHRPGQEGEADHHLPAEHGSQRRRAPAGDRLAAAHRGLQVATPVNWKQGDDVIIAGAVSDEDAKEKFPKGWKSEKPYLRWCAQPGKK